MDINQILQTLDTLFSNGDSPNVEEYLIASLTEALSIKEHTIAITLLNELIGYYRSISRIDDAVMITDRALTLIDHVGLQGSLPYATTLLNGATAYRAAKRYEQSLFMYEDALRIFQDTLDANDYRIASLHNNMSLLFQEQERYTEASESLHKALIIITVTKKDSIEEAVTHTNLALVYSKLEDTYHLTYHINQALQIFKSKKGSNDPHYSGALAGLAEVYYKQKDYKNAMTTYEEALQELKHNFGENQSYGLLCENYALVCEEAGFITKSQHLKKKAKEVYKALSSYQNPLHRNGLTLSKMYYEAYGKPMIQEKFSNYVDRIAVGLVGHGSECFGYDDTISTDHDYGPGFCIWLTKEDYTLFGEALQEAYNKLPSEFNGYTARNCHAHSEQRVGVFTIESFYEGILGQGVPSSSSSHWITLQEHALATATNGLVFTDPLGKFTKIRNTLTNYYPEDVHIGHLATKAALMSQSGQYNYPRAMMRNDTVTANFAIQEFIQATISMAHLLNRRYTPYYKWMFKSLCSLPLLSDLSIDIQALSDLECQTSAWITAEKHMDDINLKDKKVVLIEKICTQIISALKEQGFTLGDSDYLEHHVNEILSHLH